GVQLWNCSVVDNLRYGLSPHAPFEIGWVLEQADLLSILKKFPDGLQKQTGEGGGLLSGGEGQRVRFARALLRKEARLVILDEPFRGLDREKRRELLQRARLLWKGVTLLCITHDVGETLGFDRVLTVDGGTVVEQGAPSELAGSKSSLYARLLEAE